MTRLLFPSTAAFVIALTLAPDAAAQSLLSTSDFEFGFVPIHSRPAHPKLGSYGTWAAGRDYKVSFHEGFDFHLYGLGEDKPPWRWRTVGVRMGEDELLSEQETPKGVRDSGTRFEYRYSRFLERYDLNLEGVEQSFVIHERPKGKGDLVVRGSVTSPLESTGETSKSGALIFGGTTGPRIEYGMAIAIDANGQTVLVKRLFEDGVIQLVVPGGWLAGAAFPLTVDPFLSGTTQAATRPTLLRIEPYSDHRVLLGVEREGDAYAFLCLPDLSDPRPILASMASDRVESIHDAGFVDAPRRWAVALVEQSVGALAATIYLHDGGNTNLASGTALPYPIPNGLTRIAIGGTSRGASGVYALVCVGSSLVPFSTTAGGIGVQRLDARVRALVPGSRSLVSGGVVSSAAPRRVLPSRGPSRPWLVLYGTTILGSQTSQLRLVAPNSFAVGGSVELYPRPSAVTETDTGRYLIAADDGTMWRGVATGVNLATTSAPHSLGSGALLALTYDPVANQRCVVLESSTRPGYRLVRASRGLCVIEEFFVHPRASHAVYDSRAGQFVLASYLGSRDLTVGYRLVHDHRGGSEIYGTGCGGTISSTRPFPGARCHIGLRDAAPNTPATLTVSPVRRTVPLGPGCQIYLDMSLALVTHATTTTPLGTAIQGVDLPDCPALVGQLYAQWVTGATTPRSTAGLKLVITP